MQHQEKYNFTWHTYSDHLRVMMKEMMTSGDFTDVTLVCDDKKKIRAHRNILAACSPVFKEIFQIENSSVIFLKGVNFSEMESILQFIYLGEATFFEERMNHFLEAAKSLDIQELDKEVDETEEDDIILEDSVQAKEIGDSETKNGFNEYQTIYQNHQTKDTAKNRQVESTKISRIQNDENQCVECDKRFSGRSGLFQHNKAVHEGVTHDCSHCEYKAARKTDLKLHIESKHYGINRFKCDFCNYKCNKKHQLQSHIKNNH